MDNHYKSKITLAMIFVALVGLSIVVTGCSKTSPKSIAVYPQRTPIAQYPPLNYHANLKLWVSDVNQAAQEASQLAFSYNGSLINSKEWFENGERIISLELTVPTEQFKYLLLALHNLGNLASEQVDSAPIQDATYTPYAYITLQLYPGRVSYQPVTQLSWDPIRTFRRAFEVFVTIFGFIVDILIWILVVGGPFLLLGWALFALFRRLSRKP
jgi:hypothetical protein